jgi:hypothetical protein
MPRRLDPKNGLPGLFERGRSKSEDMAFLVKGEPKTPAPRAKARGAKRRAPVLSVGATETQTASESAAPPIVLEAPLPVAVDLELAGILTQAAPPRRVPVPRDDALAWSELPDLVACAFGWAGHALRGLARRG